MKRSSHISAPTIVDRRAFPTTNNSTTLRIFAATVIFLMSMVWLAAPAIAQSLSGSFDGVGTLTPTMTTGIYIQNFTGDGADDMYGAFDAASQSMIDFTNPPYIVITDTMWSQTFTYGILFGSGSGTGMGNGHGMATFTIDLDITDGTGIFDGLHGDVIVTGTITQTGPLTDAVDATYMGHLVTPEPSSLSLLFLGAGFCYRLIGKRWI